LLRVVAPAFAVAAMLAGSITLASADPPTSSGTAVFEVTGSGTVYSIDLDPGGRVGEDTAAPFSRTVTVGPGVSLLQVVVITKTGSQGCRITVDGKVLAEQPIGDTAHCIATL
jgi:hypothetical protein